MENLVTRARAVLAYVRTHRALVTSVAVAVVGLVAHFVPALPADDILRYVAYVLDAVA
jgi:hypothetical protein